MIIVGYVSNTNGMASWCWEAARALQENGLEVYLICSNNITIPEENALKIIRYEEQQNNRYSNIIVKFFNQSVGRVLPGKFQFAKNLHLYLLNLNIQPNIYLFNQPNLVSKEIKVPQFTVAWAYPSSLKGYLGKVFKMVDFKFNKSTVFTSLDALGWFFKDIKGYKTANKVLAVSKKLEHELLMKKINAVNIYPCIGTEGAIETIKSLKSKIQVVITALNLEEPRKRVKWLLSGLIEADVSKIEIHLVGFASDDFKDYYSRKLTIVFHGIMTRTDAVNILEGKDIFIFGSKLDDWGYVQTEAMSKGLVVIAPNLSPFDEIVGNPELLYLSNSKEDFIKKVNYVVNCDIQKLKKESKSRSNMLFSRKKFAESIVKLISEKIV